MPNSVHVQSHDHVLQLKSYDFMHDFSELVLPDPRIPFVFFALILIIYIFVRVSSRSSYALSCLDGPMGLWPMQVFEAVALVQRILSLQRNCTLWLRFKSGCKILLEKKIMLLRKGKSGHLVCRMSPSKRLK